MKYYILLAFFALTFISCNQNNPKQAKQEDAKQIVKDALVYELINFYKTTPSCKTDSCEAYVKAVYPVFKVEALNKFITNIITTLPYNGQPTRNLNLAADSFINDYLRFKKEFPDSPAGYAWDQNFRIAYQDKDFINFAYQSYIYTGGAHGLETIQYFNISKKDYQIIQLKDIFDKDEKAQLNTIAEQIFRKQEGLKANDNLDSYFFDDQKFSLNENFIITNKGLEFLYNPYEIKAYAYGRTMLFIPYQDIKEIIKKDSILSKFKP
ncbi:DUF3298 and DUF4163 domain-containing protein [Pedobacter glucosidilyticus]|uniref:DUF3298 and DUF4163 domain-containing protein n=1 Tax=Pedobacter glucosidilyticus TaxID=1122941 RepID=UPI0004191824|nr:DUF3298 and DUF4163 domain-containing protein [Pedobacter glucosidilyticus]